MSPFDFDDQSYAPLVMFKKARPHIPIRDVLEAIAGPPEEGRPQMLAFLERLSPIDQSLFGEYVDMKKSAQEVGAKLGLTELDVFFRLEKIRMALQAMHFIQTYPFKGLLETISGVLEDWELPILRTMLETTSSHLTIERTGAMPGIVRHRTLRAIRVLKEVAPAYSALYQWILDHLNVLPKSLEPIDSKNES